MTATRFSLTDPRNERRILELHAQGVDMSTIWKMMNAEAVKATKPAQRSKATPGGTRSLADPAPLAAGQRIPLEFTTGGDTPEVIWRRGLRYRAAEAYSHALYEDWSGYHIDDVTLQHVRQAAEQWAKLVAYLEELREGQVS